MNYIFSLVASALFLLMSASSARAGDRDEALEIWNQGYELAQKGEYEKALANYERYRELKPEDKAILFNIAEVYDSQERWDEAVKMYSEFIKYFPKDADGYSNRGLIYSNTQEPQLSLADFGKSISLNPNHWPAYHNRGLLYLDMKKYDLARKDFDRAIKIEPKAAQVYLHRGKLLLLEKQFAAAERDFRSALALDPEYLPVLQSLAVALDKLGKHEEATQLRAKATRLTEHKQIDIEVEQRHRVVQGTDLLESGG